jgi:ribonuclease HII
MPERLLGLDEAGRGSVLGPLVVGGCLYIGSTQNVLRAAGAADSKVLSPEKREAALRCLRTVANVRTVTISPSQIDEGNLNDLEIAAFLELVAYFRPTMVFLDTPVQPAGIPALRERLIATSGVTNWVIEPKADGTYPVVGAASIAAKVQRDAAMESLGEGLGSGYPSDPATRNHLVELLRGGEPLPPYVRSRWATLDNLRQQQLF